MFSLTPVLLLALSTLALAHPAPTPTILTAEDVASNIRAHQAASTVTTENGLTTDTACKPVIMIFARGTNEDGNVGSIAGPPLFTALRSSLTTAKITVQGVPYAANVAGYLAGGDAAGSTTMASLTNQAYTKCPTAQLVLGGYSQGAQLVHNAATTLNSTVTANIAAVVVFGDPDRGQAVGTVSSSDVDSDCHDQDIICTGSGGAAAHLTYGQDAATVAAFIVGKVGSV